MIYQVKAKYVQLDVETGKDKTYNDIFGFESNTFPTFGSAEEAMHKYAEEHEFSSTLQMKGITFNEYYSIEHRNDAGLWFEGTFNMPLEDGKTAKVKCLVNGSDIQDVLSYMKEEYKDMIDITDVKGLKEVNIKEVIR